MYFLADKPALGNTSELPPFQREFKLPFGYTATFHWPSGKIVWDPDFPRIRQPRAWRKLFEAYKAARRSFFEEVAALIGGNIMVVDMPDPDTVVGMDVIRKPVRH
jgi:hypothetical protein